MQEAWNSLFVRSYARVQACVNAQWRYTVYSYSVRVLLTSTLFWMLCNFSAHALMWHIVFEILLCTLRWIFLKMTRREKIISASNLRSYLYNLRSFVGWLFLQTAKTLFCYKWIICKRNEMVNIQLSWCQ